jgi:hypothetical protein
MSNKMVQWSWVVGCGPLQFAYEIKEREEQGWFLLVLMKTTLGQLLLSAKMLVL